MNTVINVLTLVLTFGVVLWLGHSLAQLVLDEFGGDDDGDGFA